jgi:long-subunit acyl-CoA synthetase (AMP-forming)
LFIRGRADNVIVLDNGKKVIVAPIEDRLKASPLIADCVVCCHAQTHLVAVVSPASLPADRAAIEAAVAEANATLSRDEQLSGVVVATEPFSVGNGMLSGQFKPRRKSILAAYAAAISAASLPRVSQPGRNRFSGSQPSPSREAAARGS